MLLEVHRNKSIKVISSKVLLMFCLLFGLTNAKAQSYIVQDTIIKSYTVQNGENLYTISFKFKVSKELICKVNNCKTLTDLKLITGHKIYIPQLVSRKVTLGDNLFEVLDSRSQQLKEDSIRKYAIRIQAIEDSLFLFYVILDKRRDSISKYNTFLSQQTLIAKSKKDSLINANNIAIREINIKDSIDRYWKKMEAESKYLQFKKDSTADFEKNALIAQRKTDSIRDYELELEKNKKYALLRRDSIERYEFRLRQEDSMNAEAINAEKMKVYRKYQEDSLADAESREAMTKRVADSIERHKINLENQLKYLQYQQEAIAKAKLEAELLQKSKDSIAYYDSQIESKASKKTIDSLVNIVNRKDSIKANPRPIDSTAFYRELRHDSIVLYNNIAKAKITDSIKLAAIIAREQRIYSNYQKDSTKQYRVQANAISKSRDSAQLFSNSLNVDSEIQNNQTQQSSDSSMIDSSLVSTRIKELKTVEIKEQRKKKRYKIGEKVSAENIEKSSFYLARALQAIDSKEFGIAQTLIHKSIKLNPNYTEAYMILGDLFSTFNYFDKAIDEYGKAILTNDRMPVLYYNRATNYLKMNELTKSLLDFNAAINLDSQYVLAIGGRAAIFVLRKNYSLAINDYSTIIDINNYFEPAYKARAEARLAVGDLKGAIADCDKYLETNPDDAYVYYQRGLARLKDSEFFLSCSDLLKSSNLGYMEANIAFKKFCK